MVDINYSVFIQMINFLLLIFILNILLYKPILKILDRRKEIYDQSQEEVRHLQETIEKKMADYEAKIQEAKIEAMKQRNEIAQEGAVIGKGIMDKARAEIDQRTGEFQAKLEEELDQARSILRSQSQRISVEIVEKVLGRSAQ
jgi:F-type H+-transporting ATPase subunit b